MAKKYREPERVVWSNAIPVAVGTGVVVSLVSLGIDGDLPWVVVVPLVVLVLAVTWVVVPLALARWKRRRAAGCGVDGVPRDE